MKLNARNKRDLGLPEGVIESYAPCETRALGRLFHPLLAEDIRHRINPDGVLRIGLVAGSDTGKTTLADAIKSIICPHPHDPQTSSATIEKIDGKEVELRAFLSKKHGFIFNVDSYALEVLELEMEDMSTFDVFDIEQKLSEHGGIVFIEHPDHALDPNYSNVDLAFELIRETGSPFVTIKVYANETLAALPEFQAVTNELDPPLCIAQPSIQEPTEP